MSSCSSPLVFSNLSSPSEQKRLRNARSAIRCLIFSLPSNPPSDSLSQILHCALSQSLERLPPDWRKRRNLDDHTSKAVPRRNACQHRIFWHLAPRRSTASG